MSEREDYRVYTWDDYNGGWAYLKTILAYSAKQAKAYARHALPTLGRMIAAFPTDSDPIADLKLKPNPTYR